MLSASVLGIAIGQLFLGALSDAIGRKPVYIGGLITFIALSSAIAAGPSFELVLLLRFLQGAAISSCIVLARAIVSDRYAGPRATGAFNILTGMQGLGAMTMPVFGAAMLILGGWQMNFIGMAALAAFTLIFVWVKVPETHDKDLRSSMRPGVMLRGFGVLFRNRRYWGFGVVAIAGHSTALFLMGSSSFITQNILGLSPIGNSIVMAIGMFGLGGTGLIYARFGTRLDPERVLWAAQITSICVNTVFLGLVLLGQLNLPIFLVWMMLLMATSAIAMANGVRLAIGQVAGRYGTATALLGCFQYGVGALLIPLGGIMGEASAIPAATGALTLTLIAATIRFTIERLHPT